MSKTKEVVDIILNNTPDYIKKIKCDTVLSTPAFKCAVASCPNIFNRLDPSKELPYKFHKLPTQMEIRKTWIEKCKININHNILMVCSDHFSLDDYERNYKEEFLNPEYRRKLKSKSIPTLKLYGPPIEIEIDLQIPSEIHSKIDSEIESYEIITYPVEEVQSHIDQTETLTKMLTQLEEEEKQLASKLKEVHSKIQCKKYRLKKLESNCKMLRIKTDKKTSRNILSKVFTDAQVDVLSGKRTVWRDDDLAMAFSLRQMSSRECYLYLKQILNIPLPALSCVQKWAASNN